MLKRAPLLAALAAGAGALVPGAAGRADAATRPTHQISVDARGPLALVEVTRNLGTSETGEMILDLALPERSTLTSVEMKDGGSWREIPASSDVHPAERFGAEAAARGVEPRSEPYDDASNYRLRLVRGASDRASPFLVRYRFSARPDLIEGRYRLRFPAAPERLPTAAEVTLVTDGGHDVQIAGSRPSGGARASGRASGRAAWEIAWAPEEVRTGPRDDELAAKIALARLSPSRSGLAFSVRALPQRPAQPFAAVLFVVDRSRSVGLPGLSAERELVRRILEALPPTTRFDVLFFDRRPSRLFSMSRPATREAIDAFEAEMVPDRLRNGTDLPAALHEAGALLRREQTAFGPRALLALVTDGAIDNDVDGRALDAALAPTPGLELPVATFAIRAVDDEAVGLPARRALSGFVALRGGVARELRANQIDDLVPAALADLGRGGDIGALGLMVDGTERGLADGLAPGTAASGVVDLAGGPPRAIAIVALAGGRRLSVTPRRSRLSPLAVRSLVEPAAATRPRLLVTKTVVALVEPSGWVAPPPTAGPKDKGSMDRMVVRNALSLAYMPRARACYLNRTSATPALRDLSGRVRLAIELTRGEVNQATVEASTLGSAAVEACLRDEAFAIEVPRASRSDAPVTAILNLVFRPRTPEKTIDVDLGAVGAQIDLIIEEMHRREASASTTPSAAPPPVQTR